MKFPQILLLIFGLLVVTTTAAAPRLEVVELQHRSAEELLPLIRPHLPPDGSASGQGYQLILKAEQADLAALQQLLRDLDRPQRSVLLTLRHGGTGSAQDGQVGIAGRRSHGQVRISRSDSAHSERGEQQIRGLEGRPMRIDNQTLLPVQERLVWMGRSGAGSQTQTHHLELEGGLYALARLQGDWAEIEIMVQERSASAPLHSRRVLTTVSGRLGEWIALASLDNSRQDSDRGIIYRSQGAREQAGTLWVRVQALD